MQRMCQGTFVPRKKGKCLKCFCVTESTKRREAQTFASPTELKKREDDPKGEGNPVAKITTTFLEEKTWWEEGKGGDDGTMDLPGGSFIGGYSLNQRQP